MSNAHEVLAGMKAAQLEQWQLDDREAELIKQCRKSRYPIGVQVVLIVVGFGLLFGFTVAFFKNPSRVHGLWLWVLPAFWILSSALTAIGIQSRRAKALAELILMKDPNLHEQLKDKGVL